VIQPCDCPESDIVWGILSGEWPPPDTVAWRHISALVEALVQRKLAAIRPILEDAAMWSAIPNRYELRHHTYSTPPRTPEQIRAQAAYSWRMADREAS
jgi:hypothetical protein